MAVCVRAHRIDGCASGEFGEINSVLVTDGIHDWVGPVEAERLLIRLQNQIARYDTLPRTWQREPSLARSN